MIGRRSSQPNQKANLSGDLNYSIAKPRHQIIVSILSGCDAKDELLELNVKLVLIVVVEPIAAALDQKLNELRRRPLVAVYEWMVPD